jgi:alanine racemase
MISLYDILEASNGQLFGEPAAQIFTGFCLDSRQARESQIFVALRTDQGDTHQYIEEAVQNGVSGIICTRPPECDTSGVSVVLTRDVPGALMLWSHLVLGRLATKVIGVSGTTGKSVAVEAITRVLETRYSVLKGETDRDGPLSVPLALAKLTPEHRFIVLRLGTTQPGEMAQMIQAAEPDIAVITHIGHAHTDRFGSLDNIAQEHQILTEFLSPSGLAVLNFDDDLVRKMPTRARVMTYGLDMERFGADLMAYNVMLSSNGTGFDLRYGSERYVGRWIPLLGYHQLYSVLAALVVGLYHEVPVDDALRALSEMRPLPGQMNPLHGLNDSLIIDDTHDANPESTLAALDWLHAIKDKSHRAVFVMGDMDHLGGYSQTGHRLIGQHAAEVADLIITDGSDAALIARAALDQDIDSSQIRTTYSTQDTVAALIESDTLSANDVVLVKGGASTRMEKVVEALLQNEEDRSQLVRQDLRIAGLSPFQPARLSWVDINTNTLATNVRAMKDLVGDKVTLMAVVKANAYGHGAVTVARTALLNGAEHLGVASVSEALELRDAGITAPILVMSYTPVYAVRQAIRQNITITLYDLDMAWAYNQAARELDGKLTVHVKVDTGMGRLGVMANEAMALFRHLTNLHSLKVEGVYTHFSSADSSPGATTKQLDTFKGVIRPLRASGFNLKYTHAANSAATLAYKDSHFNMVRVGIALYGLQPGEDVKLSSDFRPVMSWKTVVAQVKTLPRDHPVGYGGIYRTQGEERIAIIPVGYADGLRRAPGNWGTVIVHGQYAPIVGRVSMEKTAINVTKIPSVSIGDEVVLLGQQGDASITAEDIAAQLETINYEVVCGILPRVPRR